MTTDTATYSLTGFEATTRTMIDTYRFEHPTMDAMDNAVLNVFRAMYHSSMTAEMVKAIAVAMHSLVADSYTPQPALTRMVKAKLLRTRMKAGERLYEVAY